MVEGPMTQDVLKRTTKNIGGGAFSIREAIFVALGVCTGLALYFVLFRDFGDIFRKYGSAGIAAIVMLFGFAKPMNMPLEKYLWIVIFDNFVCPPIRKMQVHFPEYEKFINEKQVNSKGKPVKIKKSKEYKGIK